MFVNADLAINEHIFFREITHHFYLGNCVAIPKPIRPVPINKPISLIFSF